MAQPTIIATESTTYTPVNNNNANTRSFTEVDIPASANTIFVFFAIDVADNARAPTNVAFDNATIEATKLQFIDVSPSVPSNASKCTAVSIFDTSNLGAFSNEDVTASFSGSASANDALLGVVCTDGYLESFNTSSQKTAEKEEHIAFSGNYLNNILVHMGAVDGDLTDFSYSAGTEIYKVASSTNISITAASQASNSATGSKKIEFTKKSTEELIDITILISSQPNSFADISPTGDIISHDIITRQEY